MRLFDARDRVNAPPPPAVRVNGREIPRAMITREIQNHPAESPMAAHEAAARALVVRELLLEEARRRGLIGKQMELGEGQRETQEDALIRELLDEDLDLPSPSEPECRRFYENNLKCFESPPIWEAAHILVGVREDNPDARDRARALAIQIIEALQAHPDQFAGLAQNHSDCPSRDQGGNLGQVTPGQTTPAFEGALRRMSPGSISGEPVETPYGFHVIRLDRHIEGQTLPFKAVREKIADYLADAVFHRAVHQFVSLLAAQAKIEGVEIERATSPLVQ
jgi:peptidyl-prolyl cis-trans isomerase C